MGFVWSPIKLIIRGKSPNMFTYASLGRAELALTRDKVSGKLCWGIAQATERQTIPIFLLTCSVSDHFPLQNTVAEALLFSWGNSVGGIWCRGRSFVLK